MTGHVPFMPSLDLASAREIVANPALHDECAVLDACEYLLRAGDWIDQERARLLRAAVFKPRERAAARRMVWEYLGDALGVAALFALLFLFLLLTPN